MRSIVINPKRSDETAFTGPPSIEALTSLLEANSLLMFRRRGTYCRVSDEDKDRHVMDLEALARDIRGHLETVMSNDRNAGHSVVIERDAEDHELRDFVGVRVRHLWKEGGLDQKQVWRSPHVRRRIHISRLGAAALDNRHPDWRPRLRDVLARSWTNRDIRAEMEFGDGERIRMVSRTSLQYEAEAEAYTLHAKAVHVAQAFPDTITNAAVGLAVEDLFGHPDLAGAGRVTDVRRNGQGTTFIFGEDLDEELAAC